jgi:hypothetical protein
MFTTNKKISAIWVVCVIALGLEFIINELHKIYLTPAAVGLFLCGVIYFFHVTNNHKEQVEEYEQKIQEAHIQIDDLAHSLALSNKSKEAVMYLTKELSNFNAELTDKFTDSTHVHKSLEKEMTSLANQKSITEIELKEILNKYNNLRIDLIEFIPKSKLNVPFGLPTKKRGEWEKWKTTYSIIAPLRRQGYNWEDMKVKIDLVNNTLPQHRGTLVNIYRAGTFGLLDTWPPDISFFLENFPEFGLEEQPASEI